MNRKIVLKGRNREVLIESAILFMSIKFTPDSHQVVWVVSVVQKTHKIKTKCFSPLSLGLSAQP